MKYKTSLSTEINKTIKMLMVTLASMIVVLLIVFFAALNENSEKGYILEQQRLKNNFLRSENFKITKLAGSSASFAEIQKNRKLNHMEEMEAGTYITREDNKVR